MRRGLARQIASPRVVRNAVRLFKISISTHHPQYYGQRPQNYGATPDRAPQSALPAIAKLHASDGADSSLKNSLVTWCMHAYMRLRVVKPKLSRGLYGPATTTRLVARVRRRFIEFENLQ